MVSLSNHDRGAAISRQGNGWWGSFDGLRTSGLGLGICMTMHICHSLKGWSHRKGDLHR